MIQAGRDHYLERADYIGRMRADGTRASVALTKETQSIIGSSHCLPACSTYLPACQKFLARHTATRDDDDRYIGKLAGQSAGRSNGRPSCSDGAG